MTALDPLAELLRDLTERGKPSFAWVVRWSQDGGDPVRAAWEASSNPRAMLRLIRRPGEAWPRELQPVAWRVFYGERGLGILGDGQPDGHFAREIRAAVPHVPTLAELLAVHLTKANPNDQRQTLPRE